MMDVSKMKVAEIKKELKDRGLNQAGNKQELVARLQEAIEAEVIGQDDDVVDDLNESESVEVNAKEEEEVLEPKPEEVKPVKKIVLNRQNHIEIEAPKEASATEATTPGADDADKKPAMSAAERLALRAKRFGSSLEETTPAAAPTPAKTTTSPAATTVSAPAAKKAKVEMSAEQLEVLRKRAERFGTIAPVIEAIEIADKKKQRLDRFITTAATADATPAETPAVEATPATPLSGPAAPVVTGDIKAMSVEERKRLRAERFK